MGIKRDSFLSLTGAVATGAVMLVSVPLLLHKIGDARFGALTLVWLLAGYAGLFDFGLSRATARDIARTDLADLHANILWSAVWLSGLIGSIIGTAVYFFSEQAASVIASNSADVISAVHWIAPLIPIALISGVFVGALEGRRNFVAVNVGQVLTAILMQSFPAIAAYSVGPELKFIVPAAVLARLVSAILFGALTMSVSVRAPPRFADWTISKSLLTTGSWFSIASILGSLFSTIDKFFIASVIGPSAVAHYSVPESVVRRASLVPLAMVRPLFPRLAGLDERGSYALAERAIDVVISITTPIAVIAILGIQPFLQLWVGEEFSQISAPIGALIALGLWFNSVAFIPDAYLQGRGRASTKVLCSLIELFPHLLSLYLGLRWFGLKGGAIALLAVTVLDLILLSAFSKLKIWKLAGFWIGGAFAVAAYVTSILEPQSVTGLMIATLEILASAIWSLSRSKDLQMAVQSLFDRVRLVLLRGIH